MAYTVFSCGIFYERLGPGGLATYSIGSSQPGGPPTAGDYLVNVEAATAEIIETNAQGRPVQVSMTSVYDVARFIAAAIDLGPSHWQREYKMRGDQLTTRDIVELCSTVRGGEYISGPPRSTCGWSLKANPEQTLTGPPFFFCPPPSALHSRKPRLCQP